MNTQNKNHIMDISNINKTKFNTDKVLWLSPEELLDLDIFKQEIINNMLVNTQYCILLKVRYKLHFFAMLGNQFAFKFDNYLDNDSFNNLRQDIILRVNTMLDNYGINDNDIYLIQILYREVYYGQLENFKIDALKPIISNYEYNHIKRLSRYLPLSFDTVNFGKPLISRSSGNIVNSVLTLTKHSDKNEYIDFIERFNRVNSVLPVNVKYPLFKSSESFFQNSVNGMDTIIVVDTLSEHKLLKKAYSLSGVFLAEVEDINLGNNSFVREFKDYKFLIKNNSIIYSDKRLNIDPITIELYKDKGNLIENIRIGVIDLETYNTSDGTAEVYALGFLTNLDTKPNLYYINKQTLDSNEIIINCINEMLRPKYNGVTFYAHNFGRFDVVFILKALLEYNKKIGEVNPFILGVVCRDDTILKLSIKRKSGDTLQYINILDSYCILTDNLKDLCINYQIEVTKGDFPHKFASKTSLFYTGATPSINYYTCINNLEYLNLKKDIWNFKEESLSYLSKDLTSLYLILVKVNKTVFLDFSLDMTKCLTISKLAYEIFTKHYLSKHNPIPLVNKKSIYKDIKSGYYGGITEVYKPYGENLYYYDVNSLYPYVSLNDMVGLECHKQEYINKNANLDELFGFFYCDVEAPLDQYLGLLPVRSQTGIEFPVGKWSGMYFSEELKFARENGYKIVVKWGYNFNRISNVFNKYVESLYNMKSNPENVTQKNLAKSLLNNLLGRFGMDFVKPITKIVDNETYNDISLTRKITSKKNITDQDILLTYSADLDKSTCDSFGLDIIKLIKDTKLSTRDIDSKFKGVSVPIAAAITAYGRIHISRIKLKLLGMGGNIYYSDTDSIVTDIELPAEMVEAKSIGKLKLEYKINKGYFIGAKTYCLITDSKVVIRAKGVDKNTLSVQDFIEMYIGNSINTAVKKYAITDYSRGSVVICDKEITLNPNSYTKRAKVYKDNLWIDTKPLVYVENIHNTYNSLAVSEGKSKSSVIINKTSNTYKNDKDDKDDKDYKDDKDVKEDNGSENLNNVDSIIYKILNLSLDILFVVLFCVCMAAYILHTNSVEEDNQDLDTAVDSSIVDNNVEIPLPIETTDDDSTLLKVVVNLFKESLGISKLLNTDNSNKIPNNALSKDHTYMLQESMHNHTHSIKEDIFKNILHINTQLYEKVLELENRLEINSLDREQLNKLKKDLSIMRQVNDELTIRDSYNKRCIEDSNKSYTNHLNRDKDLVSYLESLESAKTIEQYNAIVEKRVQTLQVRENN